MMFKTCTRWGLSELRNLQFPLDLHHRPKKCSTFIQTDARERKGPTLANPVLAILI